MASKPSNLAFRFFQVLNVMLVCQALGVLSRSVQTPRQLEERDPMIALPSGQEPQPAVQYVTYQQVDGPQPDSRHELVLDYQQTPTATQTYQGQQQEQQYELVQVQQPSAADDRAQHSHDGVECTQRHEYAPQGQQAAEAPTASPEYSGQLIYLAQGKTEDSLRGVADSWANSADLPATILSEVPVKDMPEEVLSRLRREYGVKVVATRERPGANLVINCDEYASSDSQICARHLAGQAEAASYEPQPAAGAQVIVGEPTAQPPRIIHSFQHEERVVQPMMETANIYVSEEPVEGQQANSEERESSEGADGQAGEQAGEPERGSAAFESQNVEAERAEQAGAQADEAGGADQQQEKRTSPSRASRDRDESYELAAGFDEQQQKSADEQDWRQGAQEGPDSAMQRGAPSWQPAGEAKQVEAATKSHSGTKRATR